MSLLFKDGKGGEIKMSKYQKLWEYVQQNHPTKLSLLKLVRLLVYRLIIPF